MELTYEYYESKDKSDYAFTKHDYLAEELAIKLNNSYIVVLVTVGSQTEAEKITQSLLEHHLIACVNIIGPVNSHFHWSGKIEHSEEYLLLMKTKLDLFEELSEKVRKLHSYEVPEILCLPVTAGYSAYLSWLGKSLK